MYHPQWMQHPQWPPLMQQFQGGPQPAVQQQRVEAPPMTSAANEGRTRAARPRAQNRQRGGGLGVRPLEVPLYEIDSEGNIRRI